MSASTRSGDPDPLSVYYHGPRYRAMTASAVGSRHRFAPSVRAIGSRHRFAPSVHGVGSWRRFMASVRGVEPGRREGKRDVSDRRSVFLHPEAMIRNTISLALAVAMLAQTACASARTRPETGRPGPDSTLVTSDPNHCPGRRVARVGIMTAAGVAMGWATASVVSRIAGPGDDVYSRRFRRRATLGVGALGAIFGTWDAIRGRCEDLPLRGPEPRRPPVPPRR